MCPSGTFIAELMRRTEKERAVFVIVVVVTQCGRAALASLMLKQGRSGVESALLAVHSAKISCLSWTAVRPSRLEDY